MKTIPLNRGHSAIVNDEDFDWLSKYRWYFKKEGRTNAYAVRSISKPKKKSFYMHREIVAPEKGQHIDHVNGNGLDNRRKNLRLCDRIRNGQNRRKNYKGSSKYKGVHFEEGRAGCRAMICVDKRPIRLGTFKTEKEAAIAYNNAAKKYFGEFARLNKL